MESYLKIKSLQGSHDATGQKNLADFVLQPNSGSYDLSKSYFNINCQIFTTQSNQVTAGSAPPAVFNSGIIFAESGRGTARNGILSFNQLQSSPAIIVKNARMHCSKGRVEELRRVDCLRSNLACYEQSFNKMADGTTSMSSLNRQNPFISQPMNALHSDGDEISQTRFHNIRIPVSDVFNIGKNPVWDTSNYGMTKMELELNLEKLVGIDPQSLYDTLDVNYNGGAIKYNAFDKITAGAGTILANTVGTEVATSALGGLFTSISYENLEDCPFYVGQLLNFTLTGADTGPPANETNRRFQITKLIHHIVSGKVQVVTNAGINANVLANTASYVPTAAPEGATFAIQIANIELVAKATNEKDNQAIQYTTYQSQEDTVPASSSINRTYQLPPNTTNVFVMFNNPIISSERLETYRLSLNGEDVTQRAIKYKSPLHYDLLSNTFFNQGKLLGSIEELKYTVSGVYNSADTQEPVVILGAPVKLSPNPTQLTLECTAETGQTFSGKVIVYSEVIREI